jgi:predicted ATPase
MLDPVSTTRGEGLVGRDDEVRLLVDRLTEVAAGTTGGGVVGLYGEPGVGKSALLAEVSARAQDGGFLVLSARGTHQETHLPFACLHQLLRPLLPRVDVLPVHQREALLACFAMAAETEVNPFFTALATLELIADAAASEPVLLSLDDLDRMDRASLEVLAFVARRVSTERVLVLCAARTEVPALGDEHTTGWTRVTGLDEGSSAALLEAQTPGLAPSLRDRVLQQAGGNPLALVEFATALERGTRSWAETDTDLPMTARLESAFASRVELLDAATRAVMLVAALDDGDSVSDLVSAAQVAHGAPVDVATVRATLSPELLEMYGDS